jgi:hypothetical protein
MWTEFTELLVEIGLLKADIKAIKSVNKMNKENADKGIRMKYILFPSTKFTLIILLLIFIFSTIIAFVVLPRITNSQTLEEMSEIKEAIHSYHRDFGQLPVDLIQLIGNRPLRKTWRFDDWETEYVYEIDSYNDSFRLTSLGKDGQANTKDDIVLTSD